MHELFRLIRYGRVHRVRFVLGAVFGVLASLMSYFQIKAVQLVYRDLEQAAELLERGELVHRLTILAIGLPLLALLMAAFDYGTRYLFAQAAQGLLAEIRADLYKAMLGKPLVWLSRKHAAEMTSRITSDVQRLEAGLTLRLSDLCTNAPQIPIIFTLLWIWSWPLAAVVSVVLPIAGTLLRSWSRKVKKASRRAQEQVGSLSSVLNESLLGVRIVKAYGAEGHERARFAVFNEQLRRTAMRAFGTLAMTSPVLDVIGAIVFGTMLVIGALQIAHGDLESSKLLGFIVGITMLSRATKKTTSSYTELQNAAAAAQRCFEILDDHEHEPTGRVDAAPLQQAIEFRNVTFGYGDQPVLRDLSLTIPKGQVIALVGESGSGKTTLTNLVARFYDVTAGSVTWDGTDLREISPKSLRSMIALVTQDVVVFDDTVTANIAYAETNPDIERVKAAARAAHAEEFIRELENGYDTKLGQAGNRLSGGQRQRIAIARALYKDAPVLILDEATSNLDSQSEALVQDALAKLLEGRTALVVAHRLATVQAANRIVVMAEGRIVQSGTHRELIATEGPYKQLHLLQSGAA